MHCQAKARMRLSFSLRVFDMLTVLKELEHD